MNERTRSRLSRADRPARSFRQLIKPDTVAIAVAVVAVVLVGQIVLDGPSRVSRLTLANPSEFDIGVDVASGSGSHWLPVAVLERGATREYSDVLDQGSTWKFRFRAQGRDGGEVSVPRDQLSGDGWRLTVPDEVAAELRRSGAPANP
jgi:hypothetical protein